MRGRPFALLAVCAALAAAPVPVAFAQFDPSDGSPQDCVDFGCDGDSDGGIPDGFVAFGVLVLIVGIGLTIYRVSMARQMARDAGMDPDQATAVTLLGDDGLDATYIATSLRPKQAPAPPPTPPTEDAGERLRELVKLRDEGLVTPAEYDKRRQAIIDSV